MQNEIHIETSLIPDYHRIKLAEGALALTEQVFAMPGAEERYQAWLKERRAKQVKVSNRRENRRSAV